MARGASIKVLRTTRANLNTQAAANGLIAGEPYLITDEGRIAVALTTSTYETCAKASEIGAQSGMRDLIINGDGRISQRTYSTVADDAYWCDQHYVLTQTAAITPTILADVADGLPSMMRLSQSQATAQRMGNAQIIESRNCKRYRGKTRTLAGKLRCSSSQPIRFAILEWTGTADAVVSDVVNSWTNGTFTAGQFFNSTTLTVRAVGVVTPAANTVTDWSLVATLGSSFNNLILVYWTEGTAAQNVTLDMAWEFLPGDVSGEARLQSQRDYGTELRLCRRYARVITLGGSANRSGFRIYGYSPSAGGQVLGTWTWDEVMWTDPTPSILGTWAVTNASQPAFGAVSRTGMEMYVFATAAGMADAYQNSSDDGISLLAEL